MGDWEPGHFRPVITLWAKIMLMSAMMVRGIDYASGDSGDTARRLTEVESAAPLWVWGGAFVLAATAGFFGMAVHRRAFVLWAHVSGGALYMALGFGVAMDVSQRSPDLTQGTGWVLMAILIGAIATGVAVLRDTRSYYDWWIVGAWGVSVAVGLLTLGMDGLRSGTILLAVGGVHIFMAVGTAELATRANIERARQRAC